MLKTLEVCIQFANCFQITAKITLSEYTSHIKQKCQKQLSDLNYASRLCCQLTVKSLVYGSNLTFLSATFVVELYWIWHSVLRFLLCTDLAQNLGSFNFPTKFNWTTQIGCKLRRLSRCKLRKSLWKITRQN